MSAAEKADRARNLAAYFREGAEETSRYLSEGHPRGVGGSTEVRDGYLDALADLAELIASIDWRQV